MTPRWWWRSHKDLATAAEQRRRAERDAQARRHRAEIVREVADVNAAMEQLASVAQSTHFLVLDLATKLRIEDRTPVSWEVERERFMRRLGVLPDDGLETR